MTQAFSSTLSVWPRSKSLISALEARELIALTAPITGTALTNMGMSITDTVMMGWSGPEALAAGAVVSDLYSIVYYFMAGILSASAALMAQALGARRGAEVRRVLRQGFFAAAILTIPAFFLVWNASSLLRMFGVEETVIELGNGYRQMMALTIVPMMFVAVWRNAFAALGRPKIFLVATLLALPANGLANAVFMFGFGPVPAMGVAGAGLSSAIVATGLAVGFAAFAVLNTEMRQLCLFRRCWRVDKRHLAEIFRLGIPDRLFEHWRSWCVSAFHRDHQSVRRDRVGGACHHPADGGCRLRLDPWTVAGGNRARRLCRRSRRLAGDGRIRLDSASRWNSFRSSHLCCPRRHRRTVCLGYSSRMARSERLLSPPPPRVCCFCWALLTSPSDRPHPPRLFCGASRTLAYRWC